MAILRECNHNKLSLHAVQRNGWCKIEAKFPLDRFGSSDICDFLMLPDDSAERAWNLIIFVWDCGALQVSGAKGKSIFVSAHMRCEYEKSYVRCLSCGVNSAGRIQKL